MKKLLLAFVAAMLVLCLAIPAAFAATDEEIDKLNQMVDRANEKIVKLVEKAQQTPVDDVEWLLAKVAEIKDSVDDYAASIGAEIECTYTTYTIDGQDVEIDPLRVVNVGSGTGGNN